MIKGVQASQPQLKWAPIIMTGVSLLLAISTGIWGLVQDLKRVADSMTRAEVTKFQSHAERTVFRIESEIQQSGDLGQFVADNPRWFDNLWQLTVERMPEVLYGGVLNVEKQTLASSDHLASGIGIPLPTSAHSSAAEFKHSANRSLEAWSLLPSSTETHNRRILDCSYPIKAGETEVGYYRTGMDFDLLQSKIAAAQKKVIGGWSVILLFLATIVAGACLSLYRLGMDAVRLEQELGTSETRRVEELHRLIIGLAHEVRNPLNAIRLNLFASKKILGSAQTMDLDEAANILDESVEEIERMDNLVSQLLGYARVMADKPTTLDVRQQVDSAVSFLHHLFVQSRIAVTVQQDRNHCKISLSPQSFRQIMMNLLQNACQAMCEGGEILIQIVPSGDRVRVSIHDSGPGIDTRILPRIFEPFFSTRENGVGMGLAVVKGLVEGSQGHIRCAPSGLLAGMEFSIDWPQATSSTVETR